MKLAFSTLGCPDFDWSDIYSMAKDFGFQGIEIRGLGDEYFRCEQQSPFWRKILPNNCSIAEKTASWKFPACPPDDALKYADQKRTEPVRKFSNISI